MGINKFKHFYNNSCSKVKKINDYMGDVLLIDALNHLYRYAISYRKSGTDLCNKKGERIIHLIAIMKYTIYLFKNGINPFYVFDGKAPKLKQDTISSRILEKKDALNKILEIDKDNPEFIKYFKKSYSMTKTEISNCIELLNYMGIPNIRSYGEADICCAELSKNKHVKGVITNDVDLLLFGTKKIIKGFFPNNINEEIDLNDIYTFLKTKINEILLLHKKEKKYNLDNDNLDNLDKDNLDKNNLNNDNLDIHNIFIDFSLLLGSDYTPHIKGFNPSQLFEIFVLNDFDIKKTIDILNEYIINDKNKNEYEIPNDFVNKAIKAKNYYLQSYNLDKNIKYYPSVPNIDKLYEFLYIKNGLEENYVINFINELFKWYYVINEYNQINDKIILNCFKKYKYRYLINKYNSIYKIYNNPLYVFNNINNYNSIYKINNVNNHNKLYKYNNINNFKNYSIKYKKKYNNIKKHNKFFENNKFSCLAYEK